ncbi:LysR substrate-binding domain-containing protein [Zavarzinia sp.]|uniref:LysR substrate-binding domain-containing protein n=1 Tax=Zavarzinia sp. TaxID=2027920 RepID=UPI00356A1886
MDLRSLRYFVAVAQTLNIGRAASNLHISQPPLTRQIQQLEADLGVTLFIRNTRGVTLTDAGALLLKESQNILNLVEQAADHVRSAGQGRMGRMDIGIFGSGTLNLIPRIIADFHESNPEVSIVLHTMTRTEQIEALLQRRILVGFNRFVSPTTDIAREVMLTEKMYVALHESDSLASRDVVTISDLEQRSFVMFPTGSRPNFIDRVIDWCRDAGFAPHVSQEVGDAVTAVALVSAHLGICIVPQSTTIMRIPKITYRPLVGGKDIAVDLSCIYRKGEISPILREFLRSVRSTIKARPQGIAP